MKSTADKREREKRMVSEMIALYCRKKHHTKGGLCPECADPVMAVSHVIESKKEKKRLEESR